jgi:metal-responsive CopG/Arc/MetJ family transcriptional regulator
MRKNDHAVQIEFVCPKSLAEELDRLAQDQFCSRSAILRRLIAEASNRAPAPLVRASA